MEVLYKFMYGKRFQTEYHHIRAKERLFSSFLCEREAETACERSLLTELGKLMSVAVVTNSPWQQT